MGSSRQPASTDASPEFLRLFRAHAGADGRMPFARFMELALYDAELGYYRRARPRIGYGGATDFFTASTSNPLFGELVSAACSSLLGGSDPRSYSFVEIGAEPGAGVLANVVHPFGGARNVRVGEPLELSSRCVVFSNELFDAQPFHRYAFRRGAWRELGVALAGDAFTEVELEEAATVVPLPHDAPENYVIDAPLAASALAETLAKQPWTGLFVACDYGKSWGELTEACPAGTARAYHRHTQSNDLLGRPGEQDLTCHVCWEWLGDALVRNGFASPTLESQEAFFVRHAAEFIAGAAAADAPRFSPRKLSLMQLLHPAHLGQKFQVMHARRE